MLRQWQFSVYVFVISAVAFLYPSNLQAAAVDEILARINRLAPAERQAVLVREAKNERSVVWYAPMIARICANSRPRSKGNILFSKLKS